MSEYKEFKAKDLDQAIDAACKHFKVGREKLEIEIVSGGSSGIFGLVGKKQAAVRARLRQPAKPKSVLDAPLEKPEADAKPAPKADTTAPEEVAGDKPAKDEAPGPDQADKPKRSRRSRGRRRGSKGKGEAKPEGNAAPEPEADAKPDAKPEQPKRESRAPAKREQAAPPAKRDKAEPPAKREQAAPPATVDKAPDTAPQPPETPDQPAAEAPDRPTLSQEELQTLARDVVTRLIRPMLPELPPLEVESEPGRVKVHIADEEHSGLIIGHQGQTIAALQYLANRIIARKAKGNVRIHLDAGDYREKQDDNLRQLALSLADKAKSQGKMQSTRPLSSYHRRLVHMALQDDESITTRSKGDGPMKRVLILPRRENRQQQ